MLIKIAGPKKLQKMRIPKGIGSPKLKLIFNYSKTILMQKRIDCMNQNLQNTGAKCCTI